MIMEKRKASYPKIPEQNWWKLRETFKKSVPSVITKTSLAAMLSLTAESARISILGPLKTLGLVDGTGKPTDLVYDWRDDNKYGEVCDKLRKKLYPTELCELFNDIESANVERIASWFMNSAHCGEATAKSYANFYLLLLKANPYDNLEQKKPSKTQNPTGKSSPRLNKPTKDTATKREKAVSHTSTTEKKFSGIPELHINIQLHISPESTAEQIDKIFESMAKHLKEFSA
jgi:hypothetical protein